MMQRILYYGLIDQEAFQDIAKRAKKCGIQSISKQIKTGLNDNGKNDMRGKTNSLIGGNSVEQLKSVIARVEKLTEEKASLAADIRDVYAEAKGNGFDTKAIRTIIKMRKMDAQEREEAETVLQTYCRALGMQPDLFEEKPDAA